MKKKIILKKNTNPNLYNLFLRNIFSFFKRVYLVNSIKKKINFNYKKLNKISLSKKNIEIYKIHDCKFISGNPLIFDQNYKIISQSIDYYSRIRNFLKTKPEGKILFSEIVLNLCDKNYNNYFHFFIDTLFKLYIFKKLKIKNYKILILKEDYISFRKSLFEFFFPDEIKNLLLVESNKEVSFKLLYHIKSNFQINFNQFKDYINFIRKKIFLSKKIKKTKKQNNVYISRKVSSIHSRSFENEIKLIRFLNKLKFKIYNLENLSIEKQFEIFANAKIILTCHGSGLTNLVASKKNLKVIEIHSNYISDHYLILSKLLGIDKHFTYSVNEDNPLLEFYNFLFIKNKNKIVTNNFLKNLKFLIDD